MTYYGVLKDDCIIANNNLTDLAQTPGLDYILKFDQPINTYGAYTLINNDGSVNFLRILDFELRNIEPTKYDCYGRKLFITASICELKTQKTHHFNFYDSGAGFLKNELIPLMNRLNELGSHEMYKKSLEFNDLKVTNERYSREIQSLKEQIKKLENDKLHNTQIEQ